MMIDITECPSCGSAKIRKVRRRWTGIYDGDAYCVDHLEFYECPDCMERIYDPKAMRAIEGGSPAFAKPVTATGE
jgi:YgiT-type zinc finger domain-containing protein